jgi:hypothetical protein
MNCCCCCSKRAIDAGESDDPKLKEGMPAYIAGAEEEEGEEEKEEDDRAARGGSLAGCDEVGADVVCCRCCACCSRGDGERSIYEKDIYSKKVIKV